MLAELPEATAALARRLLEEADARGLCVYMVGGPVRDGLLGRPLRDVDLLVESAGEVSAPQLAAALAEEGVEVTVHERFGTVKLRRAGAELDLASARRESYAHDGALPTVEPGTLEEDLRRRDFTVNALALPLSSAARERHAGIVDPGNGLEDLERRRLRIFHPRSFHDDPTRVLRAARLAPRLSFALARSTHSGLRAALRDGAFGRVSADRLRREVVKLFEDSVLGLDPARALRLLDGWHVLGALEPGLRLDRSAANPLRRLGRAVASPSWEAPRWRPWASGLALWLAPLSPALRRRALRRLGVRGDVAGRVVGFAQERERRLRALARTRGRGAADAVLADVDEDVLHALHASATPALRRRIARWASQDRGRRPPIAGGDLLEIGLEGPAVGEVLRRVRSAYLDGAVRTRDEALALARELSRPRRGVSRRRRERRPGGPATGRGGPVGGRGGPVG